MKKIFTSLLLLIAMVSSYGQVRFQPGQEHNVTDTKSDIRMVGSEAIQAFPSETKVSFETTAGTNKSATYWETIIGLTVYDLQTNGTIQNRLAQTGVELSAAFTMSQQTSDYTDRGTGYNFGYSDVNDWQAEDYTRIESERVGWPSIIQTGSGKEVVITHQSTGPLFMSSRDVAGTGSWTETTIPTNSGMSMLWPRAVAGGEDGNALHLICITTPTGNDGEIYEGFNGALLYFRSLDEGATWDIQDSILSPISDTVWNGFDGDSYAIYSRGDKVAFAVFHDFADSFVMISEDNGDTWEYTSLVDFPLDDYNGNDTIIDQDLDGIADTLYNTDGAGYLHIDEDMMTHVTFGNMRYLDDVLGDEQFSYFPYTDGLEYWNESFGADSSMTIAFTMDMDGDDVVTLDQDIGLYYTSLTGMPSMASDENGNLYVSYSGVVETHFSGSQFYRHIFLLMSEDGGETWTEPVDATPDIDYFGYETVFASLAPKVDDYIHMIYMRDFEPGLHVRGDEDFPASDNDIIYYRITPDLVVEEYVSVEENEVFQNIELFPVPASDLLNIYLPNQIADRISVYDMMGKLILSEVPTSELHVLDLKKIESGMYVIQLELNGHLDSRNFIKQ